MIRQRYESTFEPFIKEYESFARDFPKIALETGQEVFKVQREPLLDTLRFYPPELPNQKYVRTYTLRRGWKAYIQVINPNSYAVVVSNDTDYTSFVVGSLAIAESVAASFQADIHRGRWELATKTVGAAFAEFLKGYDQRIAQKLAKFGTVTRREIR